MTPAEFLAVVLPSPGHGKYCAVELTLKKEHFYTEEINELAIRADVWHSALKDCFFALATFEEKRGAEQAQFLKSFFMDLDGYATKKDAALALDDFLQQSGLGDCGQPWVVDSGGGLHVYWPLKEEIQANIWVPLAEDFKLLAKQFGFKIDMTVTADAARVLRWPGTTNFKKKYATPRPVRILAEGDVFDFEELAAHITSLLPANPLPTSVSLPSSNVIQLPGVKPTSVTASTVKLFENSVTRYKTILRKTKEGVGCGQIEHYVNNAQEDGMEPLWRGLLSWTKVCDDGEDYAVSLSAVHPYSEDRMREKLAQIKGPYPCTKMDSENPGVCQTCPHWGKVTNPLVLGREIKTDNTAKAIPIAKFEPPPEPDFDNEDAYEPEQEDQGETLMRPEPPKGYSYGENGGVYVTLVEEDEEGKKTKRNIQLLPYDLFVVDLLNQEDEHLVDRKSVV